MNNPSPQKLLYESGRTHWVFPDDIPLCHYKKVEWFSSQLKLEIDSFLNRVKLHNPRHVNALYAEVDRLTFDIVSEYYEAIANLIAIPSYEGLTSASRYQFFVQRLIIGQKGLESHPSQLEILLGAELEQSTEKPNRDVPTSGDPILDIEVSLRLSFKHNASSILTTRGVASCLAMLSLAAEQMRLAQEEAEGESKNSGAIHGKEVGDVDLEDDPIDPDFEKDIQAIASSGLLSVPTMD